MRQDIYKEVYHRLLVKYSKGILSFDKLSRLLRKLNRKMIIGIFCLLMLCGCDVVYAETETGLASWYSVESCKREGTSGVYTASGEKYDENGMTCARRSRNFGRYYKVTNLKNGKSVIVRLNDFGPNKKLHKQGRIIDLSKGAFQKIAPLWRGIIKVKVEEVEVAG